MTRKRRVRTPRALRYVLAQLAATLEAGDRARGINALDNEYAYARRAVALYAATEYAATGGAYLNKRAHARARRAGRHEP